METISAALDATPELREDAQGPTGRTQGHHSAGRQGSSEATQGPEPRRAVLEPCGRQPAEPGPAALGAPEGSSQGPDSTLHSSQRGFATQPHACSAPLESEPGKALWGDAGPRLQPLVTCHQTALLLACTETLLRNAVPAATDGFRASSGKILHRLHVVRERRTFLRLKA